jgi:iron complex outermembrane receptor protein
LKSYFLQGTYIGKTTLIKPCFWGIEKTYQSWNGLEDLDKLNDRTFNVSVFIQTNLGTLVLR